MKRGRLFGIYYDVRLTCRCMFSFERESLVGVVPGAAVRCSHHGMQTLVSRVPVVRVRTTGDAALDKGAAWQSGS